MPSTTTKANQPPRSAHAKRIYFQDFVARCFLWAAAIVTILTLVVVIGYILFRGFYADSVEEEGYVPLAETELPVDPSGDAAVVVVVNKGVRTDVINVEDLITIFQGRNFEWDEISLQDLRIQPFVVASSSEPYALAETFLKDGKSRYGANVLRAASESQLLEEVGRTKGAIGIIDAKSWRDGPGLKRLAVRRTVVAVHPSVTKLQDNRRLRSLGREALESVFRGTATSWDQVKGIRLPVVPIVFRPASAGSEKDFASALLGETFRLPANAKLASTPEELSRLLSTTPGAVALTSRSFAQENSLEIVNSELRRRGPNLSLSFLLEAPKAAGKVGGISTIVLNTLIMIALTLLFSTPVGVAAAVYLVEYAKQGRLVNLLRLGTETLAGIPSVIFGLFGFIVFVSLFGFGIGLLSGTLTITMMILPTIIRTSEEALKAVPFGLREGSLALGATRLQTIFRVVVPAATPGILTGVILAVGRAVGETAALLFTMGFDYRLVKDLSSSARMLSVHLYQLVREGISFDRAFATATILIIVVFIVNFTTTRLIGRMNKMAGK